MMRDFFFNDTATAEIYTLSLRDALPIFGEACEPDPRAFRSHRRERERRQRGEHVEDGERRRRAPGNGAGEEDEERERPDRKSTRLNSSHANISYAVFCLKKKKAFSCITR